MKKTAIGLATALALATSAPAFAADFDPAPAPTCHETYGIFAIFHCWHHGLGHHHMGAVRG